MVYHPPEHLMPGSSTDTLKIFISYSRRDCETADSFVTALEARGFAVMIDRRDLPFGEKWQEELAEFIRASDTVLWLVSANSVASKWCNWELDEVLRRKKRLIPVMVGETPRDQLPRQLGEVHILPAEGVFDINRHLEALAATLEADREWVKEHTRLADRAREWILRAHSNALLLRGPALKAAEAWKDHRPAKAPPPSEEIFDLILMSRRAGTRRQRIWIAASLTIALAAMSAAGLIYLQTLEANRQRQAAVRQRELAEANEVRAVQQERLAVESKHLAEANERKTVQTLAASDFQQGVQLLGDDEGAPEGLALLARSLRQGHDERAAVRLWTALQQRSFFVPAGLRKERPVPQPASQRLAADAFGPRFAQHRIGTKTVLSQSISKSGDGTRIFTSVGSAQTDQVDPQFRIWTADGKPVTPWIKIDQTGADNWIADRFGYLSNDGQLLALEICPWRATCFLEVWDLKAQKRIGERIVASGAMPTTQNIGFAQVSFFELPATQDAGRVTLLVTGSQRGDAKAHLIEDGVITELAVNRHRQAAVDLVAIDESGEWLMSAGTDGTVIVSAFSPDDLARELQLLEGGTERFSAPRRLGVTLRFDNHAVQLSRSAKNELAVTTADGTAHTYRLLGPWRIPADVTEGFRPANDNCMHWTTAQDPFSGQTTTNLTRKMSMSNGRLLKFVGPRQIEVQSGGSVISSPVLQSDIAVVCANGTADEVSVTTTDFVTQIWDVGLQHKLGPPFDEKRLLKGNDAPAYTRWVNLHPSGRYALLASTFWNPPNWGEAWLSFWDRQTGLPLMDRQNFSGPVNPDGTNFELDRSQKLIRFTAKASDNKAHVFWHLQLLPPRESDGWLADFAESLGGIALDAQNMPAPIADRSAKLRAGLQVLVSLKE